MEKSYVYIGRESLSFKNKSHYALERRRGLMLELTGEINLKEHFNNIERTLIFITQTNFLQ